MGAGLRDTQELRDMGFPAWTAHVSAQGTVKETPGSVNVPVSLGGQLIRPGDAIVADDDGVCVVPRLDVAKAVTASAARIAKEDANRKQLADGVLGLDMYDLRPKLAKVDYISYAEYVRRAGEGSLKRTMHSERVRASPAGRISDDTATSGTTGSGPCRCGAGRPRDCTSSPTTSRPTAPSGTTCCCGSWGRRTRARSTGSAGRTR